MPTLRLAIFPDCPACHKPGGPASHVDCPNATKAGHSLIWLDIETGIKTCEDCGDSKSMEKSWHYCSCGAVFKGGEIWQGMKQEYRQYENHQWIQRLEITKGNLETEIVSFQKCSFCDNWDAEFRPEKTPLAKQVFWSDRAGICTDCALKFARMTKAL